MVDKEIVLMDKEAKRQGELNALGFVFACDIVAYVPNDFDEATD